ncbi:hypothetical protein [Nannocystis sp.]|uniref:hypothetical protein n=1 Tax=Nannocystis sp. TaxID=1962667 RepID=UPI0025E95482|nr:hypothetical protein [Nannocystis sp.]MBK7828212.1 hypothetical protein [Nannocystis sp.]
MHRDDLGRPVQPGEQLGLDGGEASVRVGCRQARPRQSPRSHASSPSHQPNNL